MGERSKGAGSITQLANGKWRGSFEAGYTPSGGRRRVSVTATTKRGCENRLREKIREHQKGVGNSALARDLDVKQWIDIWLRDREQTARPKTYRLDSGMMHNHVVPVIGKVKLKDLSTDHIRAVRRHVEDAGDSPTTVRHCQRIFQQALKAAVQEGRTVPESVLVMEKPPAGVNTRDAIPVEDAKKLVAESWKSPEGARWLAALLQGMRQGEALGLTWDHVDFESNCIVIEWQLQEIGYRDKSRTSFQIPTGLKAVRLEGNFHLTPPKSKAGARIQPMVGPMREALLAWKEVAPTSPHGLVWPNLSGGPLRSNKDRANWKALQDKAGVHKSDGSYFVIHEARNTTASLLLAAGVDPFIITQILGHTNITTSQGYMRVAESQKRQAIEAVAGLLGL